MLLAWVYGKTEKRQQDYLRSLAIFSWYEVASRSVFSSLTRRLPSTLTRVIFATRPGGGISMLILSKLSKSIPVLANIFITLSHFGISQNTRMIFVPHWGRAFLRPGWDVNVLTVQPIRSQFRTSDCEVFICSLVVTDYLECMDVYLIRRSVTVSEKNCIILLERGNCS